MSAQNKSKKEVLLDNETITLLQFQAEREGRKLENYLEHVLQEKAHESELSEEYKKFVDEIIENHSKGQVDYVSKEDFFKRMGF